MLGKPKIIFIGDYSREDYVRLLEASKNYCELYFLFYASPNEEKSGLYKSYGKAIYWKDFTSAQQLLSQIAPAKVVFLYIESYNHVVLNLTCKSMAIPTYLLEHGLRADYVLGFDPTISPAKKKTLAAKAAYFYQLFRDLSARIKNRHFLNRSLELLSPNDRHFAQEFIKIRSQHNYLQTFKTLRSEQRLADNYIGFSPKLYEAFKEHEAPYFAGKVNFIGIPYFDRLALLKPKPLARSVILIDQPLAEQGLLQWNDAHKQAFAFKLAAICQQHDYLLYIKPHPWQDTRIWKKLEEEKKCVLIDEDALTNLAQSTPLVIGFYSTYLMPFAAYSHTTVITYEKHPAGEYLVSKPLVEAGVAHPVYDLEELNTILPSLQELHKRQLPNKAKFTKEWMYKFDGKSGERLRNILLSNPL